MQLSSYDQSLLKGEVSDSGKIAAQILTQVGAALGAERLIDVSQVHLVGAYYGGPADLKFIKKLVKDGVRIKVPTTLSASGLDHSRLQNSEEFEKNCELVSLYQEMGCQAALTCAPYHLSELPSFGDNIAWAESNAVVYANSVIGARTNMTYQYLDLFAALTGRIPEYGMYLDVNRKATSRYHLGKLPDKWLEDTSMFHLLGAFIGKNLKGEIPLIEGIPQSVTKDQLRAFASALSTTGSSPLFHALGITPEATSPSDCLDINASNEVYSVSKADLIEMKKSLSSDTDIPLKAVCLGSPHFSEEEFYEFLSAMNGQEISPEVEGLISTSRHVKLKLKKNGKLDEIEKTGFKVLTDTCTYYGSSLQMKDGMAMTNSAKWAYYAPSNLGIAVRFSSLFECLESAISGNIQSNNTFWDA